MAKRFSVVDSAGNFSRRRMGWIKKQTEGEWIEGAYVFPQRGFQALLPPADSSPSVQAQAGGRAASLFGRQWAQPDTREFPVNASYWDGRAVLRYWDDQSSQRSKLVGAV